MNDFLVIVAVIIGILGIMTLLGYILAKDAEKRIREWYGDTE